MCGIVNFVGGVRKNLSYILMQNLFDVKFLRRVGNEETIVGIKYIFNSFFNEQNHIEVLRYGHFNVFN